MNENSKLKFYVKVHLGMELAIDEKDQEKFSIPRILFEIDKCTTSGKKYENNPFISLVITNRELYMVCSCSLM